MKSLKCFVFIVICVLCVFSMGCKSSASTRVNYDNADFTIPFNEQCRVFIHEDLSVETLKTYGSDEFKPVGFTSIRYNKVNLIPPGEHTLILSFFNYDQYSTYRAKDISFTYNFLPGRFYYIYPVTSFNRIAILAVDLTDMESEEQINKSIISGISFISEKEDAKKIKEARDMSVLLIEEKMRK